MAGVRSNKFPYCLHSASSVWIFNENISKNDVINGLKRAFEELNDSNFDFSEFIERFDNNNNKYEDYTGIVITRKCGWIDHMNFSIENDTSANRTAVYIFSYSTNFCCGTCPSIIRLLFSWQRLFSDNGNNMRYIKTVGKFLKQECRLEFDVAKQ